MAWNERCSQKALGKSSFYYYSKALAAVSLNNWINIRIANASRFDSAVYASVADKLNSVQLILFRVRFLGNERKRPDCSLQLEDLFVGDPHAGGPHDFPSGVLWGGQTGTGSSCSWLWHGQVQHCSVNEILISGPRPAPCSSVLNQIGIGMLSQLA